ncbi:MAG: hypothetical protein J5867_07300 [Prevotella sp.]|nr:hypothetical protein [Prevotella sp.]
MKRNHSFHVGRTLRLFSLVALLSSIVTLKGMAQDKPQLKVDISITNRQAQEVQEPGYILWQTKQGKSDALTVDGITFTLSCPTDADYEIRTGWSKTYIQNATYKEQNGRLTFDGISLDPRSYGSITLKIEGLPVGQHSIQTYHNCWENPTAFYAAPMTVKLNGQVVQENVVPTFLQSVAANAKLVVTPLTITHEGDAVEIEFVTSSDTPGTPDNGQPNEFTAPFLNGFELNTADITVQAKEPYPANNDMHADADDGSITLTWVPASEKVKKHLLRIETSEEALNNENMPIELTEPSYTVNNIYSMNTYYWRVDEVDENGNISEGAVWCFKPRQLAFPGAEGYGRFAQGGRGGSVYHVTNLNNDHNPGSLLYGLVDITEPHTIVFDVSGIIVMDFGSVFTKPNITIAAQTAPGKGICLKASNINIGSDNICRFMRFKRGLGVYGENTGNAMGMSGSDHSIVDHCTAAWGTDETVSGRGAKNISFQYSMIAEALGIAGHKNYADGTNHGYAATIDGQKGSWHHNLLVNCAGRNWSMGGGMDGQNRPIGGLDLFNNVVYNWNSRTTDGNCHAVNFVNNYYKMGPDTRKTILFTQDFEDGIAPDGIDQAYVSGNIRENKNHTLTYDAKNVTYNATGNIPTTYQYLVNEPLFPSFAVIHSAKDAFKIVTSDGGATMPMRDEQHLRVVRETVDGTWTYKGSKSGIRGEIDNEADITEHENGWEVYPEETRPADFDTDQDGMPNWFEKLIGSNPDVADHNDDPNHDGWTILEDYLEFMSHPYLVLEPNTSGIVNVAPFFRGFTKSPVYSITSESLLFTAAISDSTITVNANEQGGIGIITMKVTDSEGATFEQRLSIAVTGDVTAIPSVWNEDQFEVARREFFTLDGKQVNKMKSQEVYLMKITDTKGEVHTVKIIKN